MTVAPIPVALSPHDDYSPLLTLLRPHLPRSLSLYSTLQTPGRPLAVYATFRPCANPEAEPGRGRHPWLVLADLGNQLRFFCSYEAKATLSESERAEGEELVGQALRLYLSGHHNGRDRAYCLPPSHLSCSDTLSPPSGISIGAIPDVWTSCIEHFFGTKPFSASEIHYILPHDVAASSPLNGSTTGGIVLPGGVVATEGREEDVEEVRLPPRLEMGTAGVTALRFY